MKIRNQDGDRCYNVTEVTYSIQICQGIFMGWNIYGKSEKGRKYLLGTRDTKEEAHQITEEIAALMKKGIESYSIPELIEDIEVEAEISELEARFLC